MADISKITLPSGTTYDIKDAVARQLIAKGVTFTICTTAADTPKDVTWDNDGTTVTGTLVASDNTSGIFYLVPTTTQGGKDTYSEYVTVISGNNYFWEKIGTTDVDLSNLGDLAYKDSASGNYKPTGTISPQTFTGTTMHVTGEVRPYGTVSIPTFTGTKGNLSVSGVVFARDIEANEPTSLNPAVYTPSGTISKPTITVTPNTTGAYVATSGSGGGSKTNGTAAQCTLPVLTTTVANENLTISWSAGSFTPNTPTAVTLPTFTSKTLVTGIAAASSTTPTFTGTGVNLKTTSVNVTSSGTFTPEGTVSQPTFNGTASNVDLTGTPAGSISAATFSGIQSTIQVS